MPWARIDDNFFAHPKIVEAGLEATGLFVRSLSYTAHYLTDGFISSAQVGQMAGNADAQAVAGRLVTVGLWERVNGGYLIHDYLDYNPSGAQVRAQRESDTQRQAQWRDGHMKPSQPDKESSPVTNGVTNAAPSPSPSPSPSPEESTDSCAETPAHETATPGPEALGKGKIEPKPRTPTPAAVSVFRENTHRYPPKAWYTEIVSTIGESPPALAKWGALVYAWVGRGYNPVNIGGMLKAYRDGGLQDRNGKPAVLTEPAGFAGIREYLAEVGGEA